MKHLSALLCVVAFGLSPVEGETANDIRFGPQPPTCPAARTVNAMGSYAFDPGCSVTQIKLFACNPKGGVGGEFVCRLDPSSRTWKGSIINLPGAKYNLFAVLTVALPGGKTVLVNTVFWPVDIRDTDGSEGEPTDR